MALLVTIAFFVSVTGAFLLLGLTPFAFLEGVAGFFKPKKNDIRARIRESRKKRSLRGLPYCLEKCGKSCG